MVHVRAWGRLGRRPPQAARASNRPVIGRRILPVHSPISRTWGRSGPDRRVESGIPLPTPSAIRNLSGESNPRSTRWSVLSARSDADGSWESPRHARPFRSVPVVNHHFLRPALRTEREKRIIQRSFHQEQPRARPSTRSTLTLDQRVAPPTPWNATPVLNHTENREEPSA
jgi:hypothetical protein